MAEKEEDGIGAIDQLYEILAMLEDDIKALETAQRERVDVFRYPGILELN